MGEEGKQASKQASQPSKVSVRKKEGTNNHRRKEGRKEARKQERTKTAAGGPTDRPGRAGPAGKRAKCVPALRACLSACVRVCVCA